VSIVTISAAAGDVSFHAAITAQMGSPIKGVSLAAIAGRAILNRSRGSERRPVQRRFQRVDGSASAPVIAANAAGASSDELISMLRTRAVTVWPPLCTNGTCTLRHEDDVVSLSSPTEQARGPLSMIASFRCLLGNDDGGCCFNF